VGADAAQRIQICKNARAVGLQAMVRHEVVLSVHARQYTFGGNNTLPCALRPHSPGT
jgi:hypothetical protein